MTGHATAVADGEERRYLAVSAADCLFGLPVEAVRDVFRPERITPVPLVPADVVGVLNLRGRIVTAIDLRRRLGLEPASAALPIAVGLEWRGESYGLVVDCVGEVLALPASGYAPNPPHLSGAWAEVSAGMHRLNSGLMVVPDLDAVLHFRTTAQAAGLPAI